MQYAGMQCSVLWRPVLGRPVGGLSLIPLTGQLPAPGPKWPRAAPQHRLAAQTCFKMFYTVRPAGLASPPEWHPVQATSHCYPACLSFNVSGGGTSCFFLFNLSKKSVCKNWIWLRNRRFEKCQIANQIYSDICVVNVGGLWQRGGGRHWKTPFVHLAAADPSGRDPRGLRVPVLPG